MDKDREQQLIRDAAKDPSAFAELFEAHFNNILRYCIYHTGHVESGRDIAAETFFKALKNIHRYKITGAAFSSWLYRIAGNEIANYFRWNCRKKNLHSLMQDSVQIVSFEERDDCLQEAHELQQIINESQTYQNICVLINTIPLIYREVLILRFIEEKKNSEICEIINKKEGTVKSLLSRGVALLKKNCKKKGISLTSTILETEVL